MISCRVLPHSISLILACFSCTFFFVNDSDSSGRFFSCWDLWRKTRLADKRSSLSAAEKSNQSFSPHLFHLPLRILSALWNNSGEKTLWRQAHLEVMDGLSKGSQAHRKVGKGQGKQEVIEKTLKGNKYTHTRAHTHSDLPADPVGQASSPRWGNQQTLTHSAEICQLSLFHLLLLIWWEKKCNDTGKKTRLLEEVSSANR